MVTLSNREGRFAASAVQRLITSGVVQRGGCGAARSVQRRAGAVRRFITSLTRASDTTVQAEEPLALSVSPATYN